MLMSGNVGKLMLMMLGRWASERKRWEADAHDAGSGGPASGNVGKLMLMMLGQVGQRAETLGS